MKFLGTMATWHPGFAKPWLRVPKSRGLQAIDKIPFLSLMQTSKKLGSHTWVTLFLPQKSMDQKFLPFSTHLHAMDRGECAAIRKASVEVMHTCAHPHTPLWLYTRWGGKINFCLGLQNSSRWPLLVPVPTLSPQACLPQPPPKKRASSGKPVFSASSQFHLGETQKYQPFLPMHTHPWFGKGCPKEHGT